MGNLTLVLPNMGLDVSVVWVILKWAGVLVSGLWVGFGVVLLSQVRQMVATVKRSFNTVIIAVAWGYFGLTVLALLMAIMML